jgi:hypothetical protein
LAFKAKRFGAYRFLMTAADVIVELKHLPQAEQSRVIQFAMDLARERQVPGKALTALAQRMADAKGPAEVQRLREDIHRGFYGG